MYQLQLAENGNGINPMLNEVEFILIPDPANKKRPYYFREDLFYELSQPIFNKLIAYVKPFNDINKLARISARYDMNQTPVYSLRDEITDPNQPTDPNAGGGSGWDPVIDAGIELGLDLLTTYIEQETAPDQPGAPVNPGTYVAPGGWVYCVRNIGGQDIGFAVQPTNRVLIAFSSPEMVRRMFNDLPPNAGGSLPYIPLPSITPGTMIQLALQNPNKMIRIKPGTGAIGAPSNVFEVGGYPTVLGLDLGGNPITETPPPPPGPGENPADNDNENNNITQYAGFALPLLLIGGLVWFSTKKPARV